MLEYIENLMGCLLKNMKKLMNSGVPRLPCIGILIDSPEKYIKRYRKIYNKPLVFEIPVDPDLLCDRTSDKLKMRNLFLEQRNNILREYR